MLLAMTSDPFNPRAAEAAALAFSVSPPKQEEIRAMREALRTVIGRVEAGEVTIIQAEELSEFRRICGLSPNAPAIPAQRLPAMRTFRVNRDVDRLLVALRVKDMTERDIRGHFDWQMSYTNKICRRALATGLAERDLLPQDREGRPAWIYRAITKERP